MAREKIYASRAQQQKAYRQRMKEHVLLESKEPSQGGTRTAAPKKLTRPKRLQVVIQELEGLSQEYGTWLDALPENMSEGEQASQLQETIEQLQEAADLLAAIEVPRGFGR